MNSYLLNCSVSHLFGLLYKKTLPNQPNTTYDGQDYPIEMTLLVQTAELMLLLNQSCCNSDEQKVEIKEGVFMWPH